MTKAYKLKSDIRFLFFLNLKKPKFGLLGPRFLKPCQTALVATLLRCGWKYNNGFAAIYCRIHLPKLCPRAVGRYRKTEKGTRRASTGRKSPSDVQGKTTVVSLGMKSPRN